jgi:phosphomevalonate kinase
MLAGEYAVLRPGGRCLALAVGRLVEGMLGAASDRPTVTVRAFGKDVVFQALQPRPEPLPGLPGFASAALDWLELHQHLALHHDLHLQVGGDVEGRKVGLGTSAAVTVATLRAVLASQRRAGVEGASTSPTTVTAWGRAIHAQGQGKRGSGYDVATISHGGVLAWQHEPAQAVHLAWPEGLHGAALFSGVPAATTSALARDPLSDADLDNIAGAATALLQVWSHGRPELILDALRSCERAFTGAAVHVADLDPAPLRDLRTLIQSTGCIARTSGAGGGDCVLALSDSPQTVQQAVTAWTAIGGRTVALLPHDLAPRSC